MKRLFLCTIFVLSVTTLCHAQTPGCPTGHVCFTQTQANEIFDKLGQLVAAKDLIIKMQNERLTSDQTIANALKVIEGYKELEVVNGQIIIKKDQIIALYERVIQVQQQIIENLEKRLMQGKSAWQKFVSIIGKVGILLAGIAIGGL